MTRRSVRTLTFAAVTLAAGFRGAGAQRPAPPHWIVTWSASQSWMAPRPPADSVDRVPTYVGRTIREIVHTTLGGDSVRVRLSNEYGDRSLVIGDARVALRTGGANTRVGSDHAVTFGGRASVTVGVGATVVSDPIAYTVPALSDLAVSLYLPDSARTSTRHPLGLQTTYVSGTGDFAAASSFPADTTLRSWIFLSGVDVTNASATGAVVTIGNSITDGYASTPDENRRWPDVLAQRLLTTPGAPVMSVANAGISGNRVLNPGAGPSALARFDRDVLMQPGVRDVIIMESINDVGRANFSKDPDDAVRADDIIFGLSQLVERAHERGLVVYGATLTPFEGSEPYYSAASEAKRQAVNAWIRTSGACDGVIDFDAVTRDPNHPARFLPAYDSGDHLHPGDAGYRAMAESIDLALFRAPPSHR